MNFLKKLRKQNNLTLQEMANKLGMTINGYKHLEYGFNKLTLPRFKQICTVFNLDYAVAIKEVLRDVQ